MSYSSVSSFTNSTVVNITNQSQSGHGSLKPDWFPLCSFIIDVVVVGLLILIGFVGNTLSFIVLHKDKNWSTTHFLLQCLAIADTLFLLGCLMLQTLHSIYPYTKTFEVYNDLIFPRLFKYLWPSGLTVQTARNWITVTVTVDRYIAVRFPLRANRVCTVKNMRIVIIGVLTFAVLFNLPRFFETRVVENVDSKTNKTYYEVLSSELHKNALYTTIYTIVLYFIFIAIGPLLILTVLNINLMIIVRRSNLERARIAQCKNQQQKTDVNRMLLSVISVFIICETPAVVYQILMALKNPYSEILMPFTNMLVTLNSSVNFFIYCLAGQKFRKILCNICCGRQKRKWQKLSRNGDLEKNMSTTISLMSTTRNTSVRVW